MARCDRTQIDPLRSLPSPAPTCAAANTPVSLVIAALHEHARKRDGVAGVADRRGAAGNAARVEM